MIRIVLVDDEPAVRQGLKMRLARTNDMRVVGEAGDGETALHLIHEHSPDVVVMDVELPGDDGLAVTRLLRSEKTPPAIVILSMHDDPGTGEQARAAGAAIFVSKHAGATALLQGIRQVARSREANVNPVAASAAKEDTEKSPLSRPASNPTPKAMWDFYDSYYARVEASPAHAAFCEYAYGRDLCQHGFATMEQLAKLVDVTGLNSQSRALDLGCGSGRITEHLSDVTGAHITGLDFVPRAIAHACQRTLAKSHRLNFLVGDLTQVGIPPGTFDILLSVDTIYFSEDLAETIRGWHVLVRDNGRIAIFYSHGVDPEHPKETFDRATLPPAKTPLAIALRQSRLDFQTFDFTTHDYTLARRKKEILEELKTEFEAEGNLFLYENRLGEANGVLAAVESGMHVRYLYLARV